MKLARVFSLSQVLAACALVALAVLICLAAWRDMLSVAMEREDQSHIILALPVAIWLAIIRADRLRFCTITPSWIGGVVCVGAIVVGEIGFRYGIDLLWHGAAVVAAGAAIVCVFGTSFARKFLPSFIALAFLLPVPGRLRHQIALPLQEISAKATEVILDLGGFPITRAGNILNINGEAVAVAEACNGMRMVGSLVLVTFAFAFSLSMRNRVRLVLLLISPLVALLVNIIRLVPTTIMYGYTSKETAGLFHDVSGWAVLVLALGILWAVLQLMRWMEFRTVNYAVSS